VLAAFDGTQQNQIRLQLGSLLRAVVSQRLARRKDGQGFVPACEILINNGRVRELIEDSQQTSEIQQAIEEGQAAWGMQSFDQSLMDLLNRDMITYEEALLHCARPEDFRIRYEGFTAMDGKKWSEAGNYDKKVNDKWQNVTDLEIILPADLQSGRNKKKRGSGEE
jgi:twitching motility protein PilT